MSHCSLLKAAHLEQAFRGWGERWRTEADSKVIHNSKMNVFAKYLKTHLASNYVVLCS
jgi:hypothetical protein